MLKEKRERAKRELGEKIISWKDRERAANEKIVLEEKKEITERASTRVICLGKWFYYLAH